MSSREELIGSSFGRLTVIDGSDRCGYVLCRCSCGTTKEVYKHNLLKGATKSCGCLQNEERLRYAESFIGKKYNNLTILSIAYLRNKKYYYNCKCDCGNEVILCGNNIRSSTTKSCGCRKHRSRIVDLVGQRFGRLVVEGLDANKSYTKHQAFYKCRCDCGGYITTQASSLKNGSTKSCGCLPRERFDYVGYEDENFKVVSLDFVEHGRYHYRCLCKHCNNETTLVGSCIPSQKSCGCLNASRVGSSIEHEIIDYLSSLGVSVQSHVKLGRKEIDIYLPEYNLGIEYNGTPYHASENGLFRDVPKYYHRDKFLLAKSKGIRLVSIFDVDYERYKDEILNFIEDIITNNEKHYIPTKEFEYTNNDFDDGEWLREFGYEPIEQLEPISYVCYKRRVYRSGCTKWKLIK